MNEWTGLNSWLPSGWRCTSSRAATTSPTWSSWSASAATATPPPPTSTSGWSTSSAMPVRRWVPCSEHVAFQVYRGGVPMYGSHFFMCTAEVLHCKNTTPKIRKKYSQKTNCVASVPISTGLWAIDIFPRSVCLFCCSKICGPILGQYINCS